MESKKPKRGRSKSVGGQSSAKTRKMTQDLGDSDQEMKDKMEAASVLSSLRFLTPQAQEPAESASSNPSAETPLKIPVTYKMSDKNHGNPTSQGTAPSTLVGKPSMKYFSLPRGSGKGPGPAGQGVVLEQANKLILMSLYNSLQNRQAKPEAQTSTANVPSVPSNLPSESIIPKSETARKASTELKYARSLPSVLNPTNPVNKHVVAALKKAIPAVREKLQTDEKPSEGFKNKVSYSRLLNKAGFADRIQSVGRKGSTVNVKDEQESEAQDNDSSRKAENTETSLPLKKRRILPQQEENSEITISSVGDLTASQIDYNSQEDVQALLRLARTTHMTSMISETPTHKPYTGDGFKPIDPSASLRVLSDVKQALTPDEDGDLPLHIAVVHQNNELVKRFVDIMTMSGKSVDRYNKLMQTPLHLAVLVKETDIIISLLQARSDPNLVDRNGRTAMHLAVEKGFLDCLETILEYSMYECELNTKNFEGYTPLHTAVEQDDIGMLVCLVKHGAYIDAQDGKAGRSVLYYAIEYNRLSMVRYLRDQGSNVDLPNYAGITPLMAPHPANQHKILDIIGKGLEAAKAAADGASSSATMKLPLARLPNKASLVGVEVLYGLSRSISTEDEKPFQSRRSSFSDPIDLSLSDAEKTNKAAMMRSSPQLMSDNTTKSKYRHGGLSEKHAVLVEQLTSKRSSDYEPFVSISKEKYKALVALSQERRKAECLKAAATKAAEAVKVRIDLEKDKRQTNKIRDSCEFELPTSSDTVVKTNVNKSIMRVHESSEKQKLAKNRMGKDSEEAALGLILDSDLNKKLLKLGGTVVDRDNSEETNINRKEPSFFINDAKDSSKLFRTKVKLSERTEPDSTESPVKSMEVDELDSPRVSEFNSCMPVLSRQVSVSSDQDKQVSSSLLEIKKDVAAEDSSDIKLSQGFDTNDLEIETSKENDAADIPGLKLQSKINKGDGNQHEKMDCFSNNQPVIGKKTHEEVDKDDTSSVEVQNDVLQMSEDEDHALVIDERVNDEKGSKSENIEASSKTVERVAITDTNMVVHHLKNSAINKTWNNLTGNKIQESSFVRDICQKTDEDSPSKPHKSMNLSDESTDSADIDEPVPFDAQNIKNNSNGNDTDRQRLKFESDNISGGKELETHEKTKITFYHISVKEPSIDENDKSYENLNEEMMCKVNEETDWETESLATSTPPLLSKFGEIVTIDEQTQSSASKSITSPPKLSHILEINEVTDMNGSSNASNQVSEKGERNKHVEGISRKSEIASSLSTDEYSSNLYHKPDSVSSDVNKTEVLDLQQVEKNSEEGCIAQSEQIESANDKTTETCVKEGKQKDSSEFSETVEKHSVLKDKSDARNSLVGESVAKNTATLENEENTKNIVDGKPLTVTKAHTLYFYDGSTYRSVKVFIDDTEASSDQFKKMFTGKLSKGSEDSSTVINSKTSLPVASPSVTAVKQKPFETVTSMIETSTSQANIKETGLYDRAKNANKATYRTAKISTEADSDKTSVLKSEGTSAFKTASKTISVAVGSKNIESNVSQLPVAHKTGPVSGLNLKDQALLQMDTGKLKNSSVVLANNSDMNLTSVVDSTALHQGPSGIVQDLTKKTCKTVSKPTVTQISMKPTTSKQIVIPRTLGMSTGKAPVANSEGTLTRINPDIKSKLSKALQSPSRKLNIVKTDSTERLYPAADLIEAPVTKEVSLRHQL